MNKNTNKTKTKMKIYINMKKTLINKYIQTSKIHYTNNELKLNRISN